MKLKNIIIFLVILIAGIVIGSLISQNITNKQLIENYEKELLILEEKKSESSTQENLTQEPIEEVVLVEEVVPEEEMAILNQPITRINTTPRGNIYVENNTIYINGSEFEKPNDLYVIEQNQSGVIFGDENTRVTGYSKFALGNLLSPNNMCGNYFYDLDEDMINSNLAYAETEKRERTIMFSCINEETIDGLQLPSISYQRTYAYTSPTFQHEKLASEIISVMLTDHWGKQDYNRSPQEIADISNTFANYMDNFSQMVYIDGSQILFSGPNSGGSSPVIGLYVKDGNIVSSQSYNQLKMFNNFLNSCDTNFVADYINNLNLEEPTIQDIADDLSCAGEITFEETEFSVD